MHVPFNRPHVTGFELEAIREAIAGGHLSGDGTYTRRCEAMLREIVGLPTLLTPSGSAALEMMALLLSLGPGDEVIMPSFTFSSTANAVALRGARPVFADIRPDTLNLDPERVAAAITPATRAIMLVHYAGVACDMEAFGALAARHGIALLEDAAHCLHARYRGRELGSFGALAAFSFHETKNIIAGEGGALAVGDPALLHRAEVIRQKGTNRRDFFEGKVDKYTWVDIGSSFVPSEVTSAFLCPQLERAADLTARRLALWHGYHARLQRFEAAGRLTRPHVPQDCAHNGHIYYLLLPPGVERAPVLARMKSEGANAIFHYVPLHDSPMGLRCARTAGPLSVTEDIARRLVRLPLWVGMTDDMLDHVVASLEGALR